jgi:membrane protein implicated in regulation of membrane protease activity
MPFNLLVFLILSVVLIILAVPYFFSNPTQRQRKDVNVDTLAEAITL